MYNKQEKVRLTFAVLLSSCIYHSVHIAVSVGKFLNVHLCLQLLVLIPIQLYCSYSMRMHCCDRRYISFKVTVVNTSVSPQCKHLAWSISSSK